MSKSKIPIRALMGFVSGDSKKVYFRGLALSLHRSNSPRAKACWVDMTVDCKKPGRQKALLVAKPKQVLPLMALLLTTFRTQWFFLAPLPSIQVHPSPQKGYRARSSSSFISINSSANSPALISQDSAAMECLCDSCLRAFRTGAP